MTKSWLVNALIDDEFLTKEIHQSSARQITQWVDELGIEECGSLLQVLTPTQLRALADEDLWRSNEGLEKFDAERFGVWLQVLVAEGVKEAAEVLLDLDEETLMHGLSLHILVIDLDEMALLSEGDWGEQNLVEKCLESSLSSEIDEFSLLSLRHEGWDSLLEVLLEIDKVDRSSFRGIMEGLAYLSQERANDEGWHSLLSAMESAEEDARAVRDARREGKGYVSVADARAYLSGIVSGEDKAGDDYISQSYYRKFLEVKVPSGSYPWEEIGVAASGTELQTLPQSFKEVMLQRKECQQNDYHRDSWQLLHLGNVLIARAEGRGETLLPKKAMEEVLVLCEEAFKNGLCPKESPAQGYFEAAWKAMGD